MGADTMMNGQERKQRNARRHERRWAKIDSVVDRMKAEGWDPIRLKGGNSVRFSCAIPGRQGRSVVAIKTVGGGWSGSVGFRQKRNRKWGSPMSNSDFLLYPTGYEGKMGVWLLPMARVIERLEAVQQFTDARGRDENGALWVTILPERVGYDPCQCDFADGAAPLWIMDLPLGAKDDPSEPPDEPEEVIPPSPLAAYTVGQLLDELQQRGLKSFSF
jgi:hypothetical protein